MKKEKSLPLLSTQQLLEKLAEEAYAVAKTRKNGVINTEPTVKKAENQEQKKESV